MSLVIDWFMILNLIVIFYSVLFCSVIDSTLAFFALLINIHAVFSDSPTHSKSVLQLDIKLSSSFKASIQQARPFTTLLCNKTFRFNLIKIQVGYTVRATG